MEIVKFYLLLLYINSCFKYFSNRVTKQIVAYNNDYTSTYTQEDCKKWLTKTILDK